MSVFPKKNVWLCAACFVTYWTLHAALAGESEVPLELNAYLGQPDDSYEWKIAEKRSDNALLVEVTSQTWHGIVWKHDMIVVRPKTLRFRDSAVLFITGGRIGQKPGAGDWITAEMLAENTGSYVALLFQVPNQPLFDNLSEDALISESLVKAIAEKDATWPALFAMAKSAVRAMDAVQAVVKQEDKNEVKRFVVTGASKRGWTTWLAAASGDPRVLAIVPIVIDTLNIQKQMLYQLETWGDWSESIRDYTDRKLLNQNPDEMDAFRKSLWKMVDPYYYRSRLTMPKLLIHGTNDPYWTVDASHNYWDELTGPKYILTLPNVGHNLGNQKVKGVLTLAVFAKYAFSGGEWPNVIWQCGENEAGNYVVRVESEIPNGTSVKLWTAQSDTKEFRKANWTSRDLDAKPGDSGHYEAEISKPENGHVAFYIELESNWDDLPFALTTQVWRK